MSGKHVSKLLRNSCGFVSRISAALTLTTLLFSVSQAAGPKIEVQGAGEEQSSHKVIIFRRADGTESKRITLNGGTTSDGKRKFVHAFVSDDGLRAVTAEQVINFNDDGYKRLISSPTAVVWYDVNGSTLCTMQTRAVPRLISSSGHAIVSIDQGSDPESLIGYTGPAITDSYLYVMNDSCQVVYSTVSAKGGWLTTLISPSGSWILLEEVESQVPSPQGWKYYVSVVETKSGKKWIFNRGEIVPKSISDDGEVLGEQYLGQSSAFYDYIAPSGAKHKMHKSRVRYMNWKPGMQAFEAKGAEIEKP